MISVNFVKTKNCFSAPTIATPGSACFDLYAANTDPILIKKLEIQLIPTGICCEIPLGYEAQIRSRSGLALKNGLCVFNAPGTIDSDYRGEICVIMLNVSEEFVVERGMRIAQMLFAKHEKATINEVNSLNTSLRGEGGFGSTGI